MKILNIISYFTIALSILLLCIISFWCFYPYQPIVFSDQVFPIENKVVKIGECVVYKSNYCKNGDLPAIVTRIFVNELVFTTPAFLSNRPSGCGTIDVAVTIPQELPAGEYKIKTTYQYQVNPIRRITITEYSEKFSVIK